MSMRIFIVVLPDDLTVLAVGMPYLRSEKVSTDSAPDMTGEDAGSSRCFLVLFAVLDLLLRVPSATVRNKFG